MHQIIHKQEVKIFGQESVNILPQPQYYSANQVSFVYYGIAVATLAKYGLDKPTQGWWKTGRTTGLKGL